MASEKEAPGARERATLSAVRFLVPLGLLALVALPSILSSSSCVLATRDLPEASADSEVVAPPPPEDASEGGLDVNTDCGCCTRAILPLLPYCSGQVAFVIPAGDCQPCTGTKAYALCQGGCYTACACSLPKGYTLEDAGFFTIEGGAEDGSEAEGGRPSDASGPDAETGTHGD
jgi:hypothetical protein